MNERFAGRLELLAAAALFSTGGAAIKSCALDGWQIAAFRAVIAGVAVLAMVPAARRRIGRREVLVGVAYAVTVILFVQANKHTTAANTIFLQATSPLYIVLLGPMMLGEPVRRRDLAFMAALAAGLALFFVDAGTAHATAPDPVLGNVLAATSGFTCALMMMGLRWLGRDGTGAPSAVVAGNFMAFAAAAPFALPVRGAGAADWAILGYLGVFQIALAYFFLLKALRHVTALEATLLLFLEPVLSPLWAFLLHGERAGAWAVAGGAVILGATAARTLSDARRVPPEAPPERAAAG